MRAELGQVECGEKLGLKEDPEVLGYGGQAYVAKSSSLFYIP